MLKFPTEDPIAEKYVSQKEQRDYGYFDDKRCCILRWTDVKRSELFDTVAQLNDWIASHPEEYAKCSYVYLYERSHDFPIYLPPQLQLLDVRFSKIKHHQLPDMPGSLRSLIFIKCCQLHAFDINDCANKCPELEELVLYACGLTRICLFPRQPEEIVRHAHLRIVDLSYNQLTHVNIPREIPSGVSLLYLENNMLSSLVRESRNTHPDMDASMFGNDMIYTRQITRDTVADSSIIYNKAENVHSRSVQESANNSVEIIWNLYRAKLNAISSAERNAWEKDGWKEDVISAFDHDNTLANMLVERADDAIVHSMHAITMKEIIKRVWTIIAFESDETKKKEMAAVFMDELEHGAGLCFTGRFTRIVNCLCGFLEGISIEISPMERLQGQISALYIRLDKASTVHDTWLCELLDILYDAGMLDDFEKKAWPWMEPFVDLYMEKEEYRQKEYIKTLSETYVQDKRKKDIES